MAKQQKKTSAVKKRKEIQFDFIKSNFFRVIVADGAFGGISPQGRTIHMALFNERRPLPQKTVHPVALAGALDKEILERRESRKAFIREIEVDVVMDLVTAVAVQKWLGSKIEEMAKIHKVEVDIGAGKITQVAQKARNGKVERVH